MTDLLSRGQRLLGDVGDLAGSAGDGGDLSADVQHRLADAQEGLARALDDCGAVGCTTHTVLDDVDRFLSLASSEVVAICCDALDRPSAAAATRLTI